ncbi:MAG: Inosine-uridine preferring nucleoside hydrolase [Deltaproteobacteria bacterium]|nr:Inosine-uridine preferring nucleoside hydrolase [Deltaproteobacteria bacterium]
MCYSHNMSRRVIIDTDGGVDDALALVLALRSHELLVEAITTVHGVVPVDQATRNVLLLLDLLAPMTRPIVASGTATSPSRELITAQAVHGTDGLGELSRFTNPDGKPKYSKVPVPADLPGAVDTLRDTLKRYPGEVTIVTLGPLTNLARALEADQEALRHARELIIMGGALTIPGNVTPVAEFNIFVDPLSARAVMRSGLPITLVPLDVTERVFLSCTAVESLSRAMAEPMAGFLRDATGIICQHMEETRGTAGLFLHDPLAVGVAIDRTIVHTTRLSIDVETDGVLTEGVTVADMRQIKTHLRQTPNAEVAIDVDAPRFLNLFRERLCLA